MNKKRDEPLLRAKEAAEYLGISVVSLSRMEKEGVLSPYRTMGGHRRYSIEMLEEYLQNSRKRSSASQSPTGTE
ncbi:MAG: helix-turn-helix domain-containing protein [Anaerolineae bacterium]|nr:helix-turn-helix domain-containing protein [Anaerolineae bacterium]